MRWGWRTRLRVGAVVFAGIAGAALWWPRAEAQQPACPLGAQAIGLSRTIEIDSSGGARFGQLQYPGRDILRDGEVILTFDDGPHKAYTRPILDALDAHCTRATFFMVGQRAVGYWQLVREVAQRGHTVATHTWSHRNQKQISAADARTETELGISAVQRALGAPAAPFFRFPYLADTPALRAHLASAGIVPIGSNIDSKDYFQSTPDQLRARAISTVVARGSGIVLMHDIHARTVAMLPGFLADLKARGYRVVHLVPGRSGGPDLLAAAD